MDNILLFLLFFIFVVFQRAIELFVARKNEKWMKDQGALEFGSNHYQYMVFMHALFFVFFFIEKITINRDVPQFWPLLLSVFVFTQIMRFWVISSLGKYWNTKILVLPNVNVIRKGPYRFIKHPNYVVVTLELIVVPLLFGAYFTAILFTILNLLMLSVRIPAEEKALNELTEYEGSFQSCNRFLPKLLNKYDN
ncbi:isoprenylcysteine carboxyl methyltransferase family protein [Neobacillus sp. FSL H8-0543]|uniref:isoprenylcysteine carboxyl methyltransferase family protein n=1 Tax=Neobacillus sp. FSL H8-0543 TaxID=2954672 RepID=UPI003159637C